MSFGHALRLVHERQRRGPEAWQCGVWEPETCHVRAELHLVALLVVGLPGAGPDLRVLFPAGILGREGHAGLDLVGLGEEGGQASNMCSMFLRAMPWLISMKNPSVSAAWMSWVVISSIREEKSCREILGMWRVVYFVDAIVGLDELTAEGERRAEEMLSKGMLLIFPDIR